MDDQPTISTHILDTEHGQPAEGVVVQLFDAAGELVGEGTTDSDGRIRRLLGQPLQAGEYTITFELDAPFFRRAAMTFRVDDTSRSCHVPLLVAPYSVTSYRGS